MTLRIIDGYDYLPTSGVSTVLSARGWSGNFGFGGNATASTTVTAFGYGKALSVGRGVDIYRNARGRYTGRCTWGCRMFFPLTGSGYFLGTVDNLASTGSSSQPQWYLRFDSFGAISFYTVTTTAGTTSVALIAKSASYSFFPGQQFYFEVQWTPGTGTSGSIEVRVNTATVLTLPATKTANGTLIAPATLPGFDLLWLGVDATGSGGSGDIGWYVDDMYFLDNAGSTNTTFLGNVRAKYLPPTGNSTPLNFLIGGTTPAATNWQSALNSALDDTKYVYSPTINDQDLYTIDPQVNAPFVYGVEVSGAYRQDDATQRSIANTVKSGATGATGATKLINQTYTFYDDIFELDPATGVAFTGAGVNGLKVGPKVIV